MKAIIKKIFHPGINTYFESIGLLIVRIIVGAFMLTHGFGKLMILLDGASAMFPDPLGIGASASLFLIVLAEFVCSILLILGVATRLSVIPLLLGMLVAGLMVHGIDPFAAKELSLLYGVVYFMLIFTGPGKYSIDQLIFNALDKKK